jgi:hypothetical protein
MQEFFTEWHDPLVSGLLVIAFALLTLIGLLAVMDYKERRIRILIDYAIDSFHRAKFIPETTKLSNEISVFEMQEKLKILGDKTSGLTMMGKKQRDEKGRFVK